MTVMGPTLCHAGKVHPIRTSPTGFDKTFADDPRPMQSQALNGRTTGLLPQHESLVRRGCSEPGSGRLEPCRLRAQLLVTLRWRRTIRWEVVLPGQGAPIVAMPIRHDSGIGIDVV